MESSWIKAYAQFERESDHVYTGNIWETIPMEIKVIAKHIDLDSVYGGFIFNCTGNYQFTVNLAPFDDASIRSSMLRIVSKSSNDIKGQSVSIMTGTSTYATSVTFLTDIDDVNDIYELQFVRRYQDSGTFWKYDALNAEFNMTRIANMVVVITHLDDC